MTLHMLVAPQPKAARMNPGIIAAAAGVAVSITTAISLFAPQWAMSLVLAVLATVVLLRIIPAHCRTCGSQRHVIEPQVKSKL